MMGLCWQLAVFCITLCKVHFVTRERMCGVDGVANAAGDFLMIMIMQDRCQAASWSTIVGQLLCKELHCNHVGGLQWLVGEKQTTPDSSKCLGSAVCTNLSIAHCCHMCCMAYVDSILCLQDRKLQPPELFFTGFWALPWCKTLFQGYIWLSERCSQFVGCFVTAYMLDHAQNAHGGVSWPMRSIADWIAHTNQVESVMPHCQCLPMHKLATPAAWVDIGAGRCCSSGGMWIRSWH